MTAEEHLSQLVGAQLASLLFQLAMARAELDRVKGASANGQPTPDLAARGAP